jgi:betaine-homocysteine S-methyltransferase
MVTMSFEQPVARSYEGDTPADCARKLGDAGAHVVGVNCLNGPEQQLPIALEMRSAVGGFVAAQPVAYRTSAEQPDFTSTPSFPYELDPLQLSRQEMAEYARAALEGGIDYIGSCCGSIQAHVRAMGKAIGKTPDAERAWKNTAGRAMSAYEYYEHTETEA